MENSGLEQAVPQTDAFMDNTMTWFILGGILGVACIVYGIVLLTGSKDFLTGSRFINGGKHRRPSTLPVYRLTGVQMLLMGLLLILCVVGFGTRSFWIALPSAVLLVILPFPFSSYMKRSKKFNASKLSNMDKSKSKNSSKNKD